MPGYVEDTIVALATPPGLAAIAVLRLSGRDARRIAATILGDRPDDERVERLLAGSHRARLAVVRDPDSGVAIDRVLVLPMLAPRSFTGEDVIEIHCHGGTLIPDRIHRALLAVGARAARPGEFTERAFLNGKLDLCQAEAVADLIEASSEAGRAAAWQQLEGGLSRRVLAIRDALLDARALVEAHLDFPEDDLPAEAEAEIGSSLAASTSAIDALAGTFARGRLAREGLRVTLVGKPNVGKSSLLNAVLGHERALVSEQPGTTRDYLEEPAAVGALRILLCDTAGLRGEADEVERAGIARTRQRIASSDVVVAVVDGSAPLDEHDSAVLHACAGRPHVVVRNKSDLPAAWRGEPSALEVSARTGHGLDALASSIAAALPQAEGPEPTDDAPLVTRARHHVALVRAGDAVRRAQVALDLGQGLDLVSCELQTATTELDRLVGASDAEDVLDRVFSRFCVGK
ncbi:MAG: tRNA uridine-5-carboxymethylaminomethyl(34) synthesis GTPase MnmE [Thermodesulfobacteriota bacterium]